MWSVSYVHDGPKLKDTSAENTNGPPEESRRRLVAKLDIQKDDIQAVLPISKVSEPSVTYINILTIETVVSCEFNYLHSSCVSFT